MKISALRHSITGKIFMFFFLTLVNRCYTLYDKLIDKSCVLHLGYNQRKETGDV